MNKNFKPHKPAFERKQAFKNFMHWLYLRYGAPDDYPWDMDYFDRIEEEKGRWAQKKYYVNVLKIDTIPDHMKKYVVEKCQTAGYDVTMENFNDAIISLSPRGAFARSFLAQIDDRDGIYSMRNNCVDANTTNLVETIGNEEETKVVA